METGFLSPDLLEITANEINFDLELDVMREIAGKVISKRIHGAYLFGDFVGGKSRMP